MALEVDIRKRLGDFQLDVRLACGNETLGLLGASGCGKSMTLKCIAGIETPDEGVIALDGRVLFDSRRRINLPPQQRRVGYLFQQYALFPNMTVGQNIACGVRERGMRAQTVATYIDAMQLHGLKDKYPAQLSGGQQQRVALARILASEPQALLLDEPFSALDSYLRWQLELRLADTLRAYGQTAVFVSHSRDEVYRLCERVCVINDGTSEPVTPVQTLFDNPRTLSAALLSGCKNFAAAHRVDAHTISADDWGVTLAVRDATHMDCIGVRAHHIEQALPAQRENVLPCHIERIVQDVFSSIIMLRPDGAADTHYAQIRMETDKQAATALREGQALRIYVRPESIMLLTKEA